MKSKVKSPVCVIISSTLSAVKPNWVRMKAGDLSSLTARCSENTTSSAVSGLPEAKLIPSRILKWMVLPSSDTSQLSATTPSRSETFATS